MTKRWFAYEKSLRGWTPVIYHGNIPENKGQNAFHIDRTDPIEINIIYSTISDLVAFYPPPGIIKE